MVTVWESSTDAVDFGLLRTFVNSTDDIKWLWLLKIVLNELSTGIYCRVIVLYIVYSELFH